MANVLKNSQIFRPTNISFLLLFLSISLYSIEVELGEKEEAKKEEIKIEKKEELKKLICFIDMEKVFQQHPIIKDAKERYNIMKSTQEIELKNIENKIEELEKEIEKLSNEFEILTDTTSQLNKEMEIEAKEDELVKMDLLYENNLLNFKKDLEELEQRSTEIALRDLYKIIKEIAEKENISVVLDKSSILYGQDSFDITEKVLQKILKK